jgi:O-antigen/teichoic acid export membrane protein
MGIIRKQSIVSSIIIYTGFVVGALNTWFFTSHYFTPEQYGLTRVIFDIGQTFFALANLGTIPIMYRFYPYYRDRLPLGKRDLFAKMLLIGLLGFVILCIASFFFKDLIVEKYGTNSPLLVQYFYVIYPFTFFFLIFSLLEAQAWNHFSSIATNFFKELVMRLVTTFFILLFIFHLFNFTGFINAFAFLYAFTSLGLLIYLVKKHQIAFTLKTSVMTRRMAKKMLPFGIFFFLASFFTILAKTFDTLLISSVLGLTHTGVFSFSSYLTSVIEGPQRGLISISTPVIAQAWKDKDMGRIERIYKQSSINMLIFAGFLFGLIWLNLHNAFDIFKLDPEYLKGETVLLLLGITKVVELGTGVNAQIIATSRYWRVDLLSTVFLLLMLIPLNYLLIKKFGINGVALGTLIAYVLFNVVRFTFIWVKFKMQPFNWRTLLAIGILFVNYLIAHYLVRVSNPFVEALLQSVVYVGLTAILLIACKVSEDVDRLYRIVLQKLRIIS